MTRSHQVAYLFDAEAEKDEFGFFNTGPLSAIFSALLGSPRSAAISLRCREGLLLLHNLAYRTSGVTLKADKYRSTSTTLSADHGLYKALIWDFTDAAASGWSTINPRSLPLSISRHKTFILSLSAVPTDDLPSLESAARGRSSYLGAVEIDERNPLMCRVLIQDLPEDYFYLAGALAMYADSGHDLNDLWDLESAGHWWNALHFTRVFWWTWLNGPLDDHPKAPPSFRQTAPSARGRVSLRLLDAAANKSHAERVLDELRDGARSRPLRERMPTSISGLWRENLEALVDTIEPKFTSYLLDETHPQGKHKAFVFKSALGFTRENWRLLARQIVAALASAEPRRVRSERHAVKYEFDVVVAGPNGNEATVLTAWKLSPDAVPLLVTARVLTPREAQGAPVEAIRGYVVRKPSGPKFWRELHRIAYDTGTAAMERHIPAPMFVVMDAQEPTADVVPQGEFGWAYVTVSDARRGFARFMLQEGHAQHGYRGGAEIAAPSDFVQPARAFAEAYALVLRLNGIECQVRSLID